MSEIRNFTAKDDQGNSFDLAALRGRPFLLKFFRGHWCPYCVAELRRWTELSGERNKEQKDKKGNHAQCERQSLEAAKTDRHQTTKVPDGQ